MIPIFNTYIHPWAKNYIAELLDSTFLSEGQVVKDFEKALEQSFGFSKVVTVNSGTSALHLALVLAGVGENDEVIIPAQTFVATGLVVLQQKAKVVFADIDYMTGNISVESIRQKITSKTKAIIPVHWGGYPCNMTEINALAAKHNIVVIEDAAHALGATYQQKPVGSLSDFTCFSFQAIKHLTTGDGGAISIKQNKAFEEALNLKWFGIDRNKALQTELGERDYNIQVPGYKYHLNNYAAALGLANLNDFHKRLEERRKIAAYYRKELAGVDGLTLFNYQSDRESAYWLFPLHVENRLEFIRALKAKNIAASVVHQRIDRNAVFGGLRNDLPVQEQFEQTQIHIPIHDAIDSAKAEYIIAAIKNGW